MRSGFYCSRSSFSRFSLSPVSTFHTRMSIDCTNLPAFVVSLLHNPRDRFPCSSRSRLLSCLQPFPLHVSTGARPETLPFPILFLSLFLILPSSLISLCLSALKRPPRQSLSPCLYPSNLPSLDKFKYMYAELPKRNLLTQ